MAVLDSYLAGVLQLIKNKDANELKQYLRVEPVNLPAIFLELQKELQTSYRDSKALERKVEAILALSDDDPNPDVGEVWPGFQIFMKEYLEYWRDVKFENLVDTHALLFALVR
jgi:hypothetical protein